MEICCLSGRPQIRHFAQKRQENLVILPIDKESGARSKELNNRAPLKKKVGLLPPEETQNSVHDADPAQE